MLRRAAGALTCAAVVICSLRGAEAAAMRVQPAREGGISGSGQTSAPVPQHGPHGPVWDRIEKWHSYLNEHDKFTKYCALSENSWRFYRGTNFLFYEEHQTPIDPRLEMFGGEDEDLVWVTGDLHPENLGAYSDSRGVVVYNMNDFDDGTVEDYQMELLRMATGLILMSRANGFIEDLLYWIVSPFLDAYVGRMRDLNKLNGTYPEKDCDINAKTAKGLLKDFLKNVERNDGREEMLRKHVKKGKFDYDSNKFEKINDPAEEKDLRRAYADVYSETLQGGLKWDPEYFKIKDVARRVNSGTGSLGLSRYYVLIEGPTESDSDDRILDVKGEIIPTPVLFWQWDRRELYEIRYAGNHAMAYVEAARALQSNEDDHLGWLRTRKGTFVVRERSPFKETFDTRMLRGKEDYMEMSKQWGYIVANSHARGRGRWIASKDFVRHFWEKRLHKGEKWKDFTALIWDVAVDFNAQVMKDFSGFLQVFGPRMKDCPAPDRV